ncbi:MAG: ABC transporter permease [Candidatus Nanopelagicaceae bacterium]
MSKKAHGEATKASHVPLGLFTAALFSLIFIAIPLVYLLRRALEGNWRSLGALLFREKTAQIFTTTTSLVIIVSLMASVLGVSLAWSLHNVKIPMRNLQQALVILPIAIPSYVFTFSWISINPSFSGFWAAVFILVLSTTPYVSLAALSGLRRVDWSQHEVAMTLGLNPFRTFIEITLPQIRNSVAAGTLLVALYVLSDFGAVSLLGVDTFTRSISNLYRGSFDRSSAAVLALILVMLSATLIAIESRARSKARQSRNFARLLKQPILINSRGTKLAAQILIALYLALGLMTPMGLLLLRFFNSAGTIDYPSLFSASISTIVAASLGALISISLALPIGLLVLTGSRLGNLADKGVLLVHALPGIVMGLALVAFGSEFPWLYQTLGLLAFSYALLFMAKSVGSVRSALARVPQNLIDISATLGKSRAQTFRAVILPLAAPGVLTGSLLVLLAAMKELPATLMLRPTGFETLATEMWALTAISRFSEAAPYALFLVLIAAIPTFLINRPDRGSNEEGDIA